MCMETNYALDLKVARRRSGLTQLDVAHLLGISRVRVSKLECGIAKPTPDELTTFSLVYSRSFLTLGGAVMPVLFRTLKDRLHTFPNREGYAAGTSNKAATLKTLSKRLTAPSNLTYEE
jgi:transcriptional regulator with XRE-family HTH domain